MLRERSMLEMETFESLGRTCLYPHVEYNMIPMFNTAV